jgi:hypothetical protein
MTAVEKSILQTLAYSEVFNFPLTKEELWYFLISDKKIERDAFEQSLQNVSARIVTQAGFYSLSDDASSIYHRRKNIREVQKKMRIAKHAAYYLSYIPTISLIGLSGGLAMGNVDEEDDIDFFIITKKNKLFMTRIWVHAILEMLNLRRKRNESNVQNKICVNLLVDETRLAWPKESHDVYTAHEIIHMKPLFERNDTYAAFLKENQWVEKFFPNANDEKTQLTGSDWKRNYISLGIISAFFNLRPFEKIVGIVQKRYMRRHQTRELVSEQILAFHPIDYRTKTLAGLNRKLTQLGLLTNN